MNLYNCIICIRHIFDLQLTLKNNSVDLDLWVTLKLNYKEIFLKSDILLGSSEVLILK